MKALMLFSFLSLALLSSLHAETQMVDPSVPCREPSLNLSVITNKPFQSNCLYGLANLQALQKTGDGYMLSIRPGSDIVYRSPPLLFLYSDPRFDIENFGFFLFRTKIKVFYAGDYTYTTISGFQSSIPAFRVANLPDEKVIEEKGRVLIKTYETWEDSFAASRSDDEPNFISKNGQIIPNPKKKRS